MTPQPVDLFPLHPYRYDGPGDYETMEQDTFDALMEDAVGWIEVRSVRVAGR